MLNVSSIASEKQGRVLFDNVNFSVSPGELLYLHGPNGAGKTTLLRILAGLTTADSGAVELAVENSADLTENSLLTSDCLYIGHKTGLNPMMSALENLSFWCGIEGIALAQPPYELLASLGLVGIEEIAVRRLSAGQQRRVALAKLWLCNSSLIILDEPFTALDTAAIALVTQQLERLLEQQRMIVMTSHQPIPTSRADNSLSLVYRYE